MQSLVQYASFLNFMLYGVRLHSPFIDSQGGNTHANAVALKTWLIEWYMANTNLSTKISKQPTQYVLDCTNERPLYTDMLPGGEFLIVHSRTSVTMVNVRLDKIIDQVEVGQTISCSKWWYDGPSDEFLLCIVHKDHPDGVSYRCETYKGPLSSPPSTDPLTLLGDFEPDFGPQNEDVSYCVDNNMIVFFTLSLFPQTAARKIYWVTHDGQIIIAGWWTSKSTDVCAVFIDFKHDNLPTGQKYKVSIEIVSNDLIAVVDNTGAYLLEKPQTDAGDLTRISCIASYTILSTNRFDVPSATIRVGIFASVWIQLVDDTETIHRIYYDNTTFMRWCHSIKPQSDNTTNPGTQIERKVSATHSARLAERQPQYFGDFSIKWFSIGKSADTEDADEQVTLHAMASHCVPCCMRTNSCIMTEQTLHVDVLCVDAFSGHVCCADYNDRRNFRGFYLLKFCQ